MSASLLLHYNKVLVFRVSRPSFWEKFSDDVPLIAPIIAIAVLYLGNLRTWWHDSLEARS